MVAAYLRWASVPLFLGQSCKAMLLDHGLLSRENSAARQRPAVQEGGERPSRVAVLLAGTPERLLVSPLVNNIISPSASLGYEVDLFLTLARSLPPGNATRRAFHPEPLAGRFSLDPRVAEMRDHHSFASDLVEVCCKLAIQVGATSCEGSVEPDGPQPEELSNDAMHRRMILEYNPLHSAAGMSLLRKWRSLSTMWARANELEAKEGFRYAQIAVVRDDNFWIAPLRSEVPEFLEEPNMVKVIPCLDFHGINDKAVQMGREAADVMLSAYEAWIRGDQQILSNTRNAEEFWYRIAISHGLAIRPQSAPQALATFTDVGLPCFRKQKTYKWLREQFGPDVTGMGACYGDADANGPMAELFYAFNCDDLNPVFYSQISVQSVGLLHNTVRQMATRDRNPLVLTFVDSDVQSVAVVRSMLRSLVAVGEPAGVLVIGMVPGACRLLEGGDQSDVPCLDMPPPEVDSPINQRDRALHRHAVLTTLVLSGLSRGILYCELTADFLRPPVAAFQQQLVDHRAVVFAQRGGRSIGDAACSVTNNDRDFSPSAFVHDHRTGNSMADIDPGLMYVTDSSGASNLLLRTWMLLAEFGGDGGVHQDLLRQAFLHAANTTASWVSVGTVSCEEFV